MCFKAKHLAYSPQVCAGIFKINSQEQKLRAYLLFGQLLLGRALGILTSGQTIAPRGVTRSQPQTSFFSVSGHGPLWWLCASTNAYSMSRVFLALELEEQAKEPIIPCPHGVCILGGEKKMVISE